MSIPHSFDPMGTSGGGLPPGYERVESILKPAGAYWQTDIPVKTGMRMEADIMITAWGGGYVLDLIARNGNEAGNNNTRLQYGYIYAYKIHAGRLSDFDSGIALPVAVKRRFTFSVAQYETKIEVLLNNGESSWVLPGLSPLELKDAAGNYETFFLGRYASPSATVYTRGECRIYDIAMYEEGSNKLLFRFVPVRKMVNGSYSYGLYDVVNRKELPVVAGTILA